LISWMPPLPFIAVIAGWFVTEIGRQPWIVQDLMRVSEGVTPSLSGGVVLATLLGYIAVYAVVFTAGLAYLRRVIVIGPAADPEEPDHDGAHPKRPWSAVDEPGVSHTEARS